VFLGYLDGTFVALDAKTGNLVWQTTVGRWQDGHTIVSAPLYHNGVIYTGISGGDRGVRGKLTALDAATGKELWRFWTVPGPGELGGDTWPSPNDPDPTRTKPICRAVPLSGNAGDRSISASSISAPASLARMRSAMAPIGPATTCSAPQSWRCGWHLCVAFPAGAARRLGLDCPSPGAARSGL
jgi:hypothetical protein